jgi:predicted nucleic-acid-binding protein
MTGLDTNVLVRFVMADDPLQSEQARALVGSFSPESRGFISLVCLAELVWVLRSKYRQPKREIVGWLERFLESSELAFESQSAVEQALAIYEGGKAEFSDCLIERSGAGAGCQSTLTFDAEAAESAGMRLIAI